MKLMTDKGKEERQMENPQRLNAGKHACEEEPFIAGVNQMKPRVDVRVVNLFYVK